MPSGCEPRIQEVPIQPGPTIVFRSFGDSSLDFELRVFTTEQDRFMRIKNDLLFEIDQAFRKAKIEIAFPQRDLHLRTAGAPVELISKSGEVLGQAVE